VIYVPKMTAMEVVERFRERSEARGPIFSKMLELTRMYNGDVVIPLPELDEAESPGVANLITQGVDALAMRISGRMPDNEFPVAKAGDEQSEQHAADQRHAIWGWWDMNQIQAKRFPRRGRHYAGYGCSPVLVKPVAPGALSKRQIPHWHVTSPLVWLPSPSGDPDDITPHDYIVCRQQSLGWLRRHYPVQASVIYRGKDCSPDEMFDLLEYNDENETLLVLAGKRKGQYEYFDYDNGTSAAELLEAEENRAGVCLGVGPTRVTLDRLSGHFDALFGMFMAQAKMQAYEQLAVFRTIFPEMWVMSHPNSPGQAQIIQTADGKQGIIGEIANGMIQSFSPQPSLLTNTAIDRLERNQRVQAGLPAETGGESASNIRTAKRGEQVMGSALDPVIGEAQGIFAASFVAEDERAIAVAKGWWGGKMTSFYVPRSGKKMADDYTPNELFDNDFHWVKFSMPGVDAAGISIELGQRTGTGEMSMETAREIDPMIEDAIQEGARVDLEGLSQAALKGMEAQLTNGTLDFHEVALIAKIRKASPDKPMWECILEAQDQVQKQQASLQQAAPGSPETQPGLAPAAPPGAPSGGPPPQLADILQSLRSGAKQGPAEQALSGTGAPPQGAGLAPTPAPVGA
jgi:hypothetical protein